MPFEKGHAVSEETRRKIGDAHRGKTVSEETRAKLRRSLTGRKLSKEDNEKKSKRMMGHVVTPETRAKISAAHMGSGISIVGGYRYLRALDNPNKTKHGFVAEHRLVVEKEVGRYLSMEEVVHHINGNTLDNRIENLRLFSNDAEHHSEATHWGGCSLNPEDIKGIKRMREDGALLREISAKYEVSISSISKICRGKTYKEMT